MRPELLAQTLESLVGAHSDLDLAASEPTRYRQQAFLFNRDQADLPAVKGQLLKWIGNKQKFAAEIASYLPKNYDTYFEPFLGSGAVLAHLAPRRAVGSDCFGPLVEIWRKLNEDVEGLIQWYADRYALIGKLGKVAAYQRVRAAYNSCPNGADLLFLSRVCYGGVVRFRKADGHMSTPCGPHNPMPPRNFEERARIWAIRTKRTRFVNADFEEIMDLSGPGDVCYLDPPYVDTQKIIYGAQDFNLDRLFKTIDKAKSRGVRVALSLDGTKKSGDKQVNIQMPKHLFEREVYVHLGRSMLRRLQMNGQTLESELVSDRLLLTY